MRRASFSRTDLTLGVVVAACALAAAAPAHAQLRASNTDTTFAGATLTQSVGLTLNRADCDDDEDESFSFAFTGATESAHTARLLVDEGIVSGATAVCPRYIDVPAGDFLTPLLTAVDTIGDRVTFDVAVSPKAMVPDSQCSGDGDAAALLLCVYMLTLNEVELGSFEYELLVDTSIPPQATIASVTPGNRALTVAIDEPADDEAYDAIVQWRACSTTTATDGGAAGDGGTGSSSQSDLPDVAELDSLCDAPGPYHQTEFTGTGPFVLGSSAGATLANDEDIELRVLLVDQAGNVGPPSAAVVDAPAEGQGALDAYDGAGAGLSCAPDCDTGSGYGASMILGFLGATSLASGRRRRRLVDGAARLLPVLFVIVGAQLIAGPAAARTGAVSLDLHVGPYVPAIDQEEKASGGKIYPIYECFYDDAMVPMLGLDIDWTIIDEIAGIPIGTLNAGFDLRGTQIRGNAQPQGVDITDRTRASLCKHGDDYPSVEFTLVEITPGITYRLDPLLELFGIPLVPYGRLGLVGAGFAFTKEGSFELGGTTRATPVNPVGARFGWEGTLGLLLALDFLDGIDPFDPWTIRRARASGVFDHAYLSAEMNYQRIDDFGQRGILLHADDRVLSTGQPLLFMFGLGVDLM